MDTRIERVDMGEATSVFDWVLRLLMELGEEAQDLGSLDATKVREEWEQAGNRFQVFIARETPGGNILGILTLSESFAIYANGNYGIINEMYVAPEYRSRGVGARLLESAKTYGSARRWSRIDVTAPESERWDRTRKFYEKNGYTFAGPKLKLILH